MQCPVCKFKLSKWLVGKKSAKPAVEGYFVELDGSHYQEGIEAIQHRWGKYIELKDYYVEEY